MTHLLKRIFLLFAFGGLVSVYYFHTSLKGRESSVVLLDRRRFRAALVVFAVFIFFANVARDDFFLLMSSDWLALQVVNNLLTCVLFLLFLWLLRQSIAFDKSEEDIQRSEAIGLVTSARRAKMSLIAGFLLLALILVSIIAAPLLLSAQLGKSIDEPSGYVWFFIILGFLSALALWCWMTLAHILNANLSTTRTLWFILLFFLGPFSAIIYFLVVYLPKNKRAVVRSKVGGI